MTKLITSLHDLFSVALHLGAHPHRGLSMLTPARVEPFLKVFQFFRDGKSNLRVVRWNSSYASRVVC